MNIDFGIFEAYVCLVSTVRACVTIAELCPYKHQHFTFGVLNLPATFTIEVLKLSCRWDKNNVKFFTLKNKKTPNTYSSCQCTIGKLCCNCGLNKYQKVESSHLVTDYKHNLSNLL